MKKYLLVYWPLLAISGIVVIPDQITKCWVHQNINLGEVYRPELWLSSYARLVHWKNTGAALGLLQDFGLFFTIFSLLVSLVILVYFPRVPSHDHLTRLALGMYLGGAIGNLIDRFAYGYVTDFISFGNFPVFNIADLSLATAIGLFLIGWLLPDKRKKLKPLQPQKSEIQPPGGSRSPD